MRVLLRSIDDFHNFRAPKATESRSAKELIRHAALLNTELNYRQIA